MTQQEFLKKARKKHGNTYQYSDFIQGHKICITCSAHGEFFQSIYKHLIGQGCKKCGRTRVSLMQKKTIEEFQRQARRCHQQEYDYSNAVYENTHQKIEIVCKKHGSFWQTPHDHLHGANCPACSFENNKGETSKTWRGCGSLSKSHWIRILNNAKTRNIKVDISIEYAWNLFLTQNKKCAITGCPLIMILPGKRSATASLDRIDSSIGYVEGNVQWVHKDINLMKSHHTTQRFYELCHAVAQYGQQHLTAV